VQTPWKRTRIIGIHAFLGASRMPAAPVDSADFAGEGAWNHVRPGIGLRCMCFPRHGNGYRSAKRAHDVGEVSTTNRTKDLAAW